MKGIMKKPPKKTLPVERESKTFVQHDAYQGKVAGSVGSNVNWLLLLGNGDINDVPGNIKEQNNGLEALGSIVTENKDSKTPMDSPVVKDKSLNGEKSKPDDDNMDSFDGGNNESSQSTTGDSDVADGETEGENSDDESSMGSSVDDSSNGDASSDTSDQRDGDMSKDPHLSLNRRILISNKLLHLYNAIQDSIDAIAEGPDFENKPVKLEALAQLAEDVNIINDSVNKEKDYKVILFRYAVCVRILSKIVNSNF